MFPFTLNPPQQPPQPTENDSQPERKLYSPYNPLNDLLTSTPYGGPTNGQSYVYNLPTEPELLFHDEESHIRSIANNLTFYTGTSYALGTVFGAAKGAVAGFKAAERGDTFKIRVNRVLNGGGMVGRRFGNNAGVLGVLYSGFGGGIRYFRDGVDDGFGCVLAGVGAGSVFRVFHGVRSVVVGGFLGGLVVGGALGGNHLVKKFGVTL
ncbi:hypothetical protein vseg_009919 [Gypsophila vaccaria]